MYFRPRRRSTSGGQVADGSSLGAADGHRAALCDGHGLRGLELDTSGTLKEISGRNGAGAGDGQHADGFGGRVAHLSGAGIDIGVQIIAGQVDGIQHGLAFYDRMVADAVSRDEGAYLILGVVQGIFQGNADGCLRLFHRCLENGVSQHVSAFA